MAELGLQEQASLASVIETAVAGVQVQAVRSIHMGSPK